MRKNTTHLSIILIFTFFIMSCSNSTSIGGSSQQKEQNSNKQEPIAVFPNSYKIYAADPSCITTKRIYITHGFGGSKEVYDTDPFIQFFNNLTAACFELISYDLPYGDFKVHFTQSGLIDKNNFKAYIANLKTEIESSRGTVSTNLAGGVSFGGLHAMMTIELTDGLFDGFFALKPVTDYTALTELSELSSAHFNVFNQYQKLGQSRGYIVYGSQDDRVDWLKTDYLKYRLQADGLNGVDFDLLTEGHSSNDTNLNMIYNWINTNF